jgi:hypothetical protein
MHDFRAARLRFGHHVGRRGALVDKSHEQRDQIDLQDRTHSVKAESLGAFVADDIRNALRHVIASAAGNFRSSHQTPVQCAARLWIQ